MKNLIDFNIFQRFLLAGMSVIFIPSLMAATYGEGPNPYSPPTHLSLREQAATQPTGLTLDVGTGMGRYQDLQPPMSTGEGRVDGSKTVYDSSPHTGPLLSGRFGWNHLNNFGRQYVGLNGMRMSAIPSSDITSRGSSYARISLDGGADWVIANGLSVLSSGELRRSMFRNTDSGHYIDSIILRTGLTQNISNYSLSATVGAAPLTQFGYMQHSDTGSSGGLAATASSLYEWSLAAAWAPMRDASLSIGHRHEVVAADVSNIRAYRNLGLNVADEPNQPSTRHYRLSTMSLTIGAKRLF